MLSLSILPFSFTTLNKPVRPKKPSLGPSLSLLFITILYS